MRPLRRHLSYANVMSTIAVFSVLATGGAYAANTVFSTDIVDGEVKSQDIADFTIKARDIEEGAVNSGRVLDEALRDHDLDTGSVGTSEIADGAVAPEDLDPSTIDDLGTKSFVKDTAEGCDPTSNTFIECGTDRVAVTLDAPSDVVVYAEGSWFGIGAGGDAGECRIESDELGGRNHAYGQIADAHIVSTHAGAIAQISAFQSLDAGTYEFWFVCRELDADFQVSWVDLTAIRLGA